MVAAEFPTVELAAPGVKVTYGKSPEICTVAKLKPVAVEVTRELPALKIGKDRLVVVTPVGKVTVWLAVTAVFAEVSVTEKGELAVTLAGTVKVTVAFEPIIPPVALGLNVMDPE